MMPSDRRFKRGVFTMPFPDAHGRKIAVAIDRSGRCLDWVVFRPEDRVQVYTRLWSRVKQQDAVGRGGLFRQPD